MTCQILSGVLYGGLTQHTPLILASLQKPAFNTGKKIIVQDGGAAFYTDIVYGYGTVSDNKYGKTGITPAEHYYVFTGGQDRKRILMKGKPLYAGECRAGNDGRPISPVPRVNQISPLELTGTAGPYRMIMYSSQNFTVFNSKEQRALEILHNGISGGWSVPVYEPLEPAVILALYVFSRYLDKENEFHTAL